MFLTETAQRADVVLPAGRPQRKRRNATNTAGESSNDASSIDPSKGRAAISDLIRILSQSAQHVLGIARRFVCGTRKAAFDEIRQNVHGYDSSRRKACCSAAAAETSTANVSIREPLTKRRPGRGFLIQPIPVFERYPGAYCSKLKSTNGQRLLRVEFVAHTSVLVVSLSQDRRFFLFVVIRRLPTSVVGRKIIEQANRAGSVVLSRRARLA